MDVSSQDSGEGSGQTSGTPAEGFAHSAPLELLLPEDFYYGLARSLVGNARDRFFPEKLPPLLISSRPVDVGMLLGDRLALPWTRTVFTNIGDVISPETLPPLQLESRPVDVGELIVDQLSHMWWSSLLRGLADAVAPERQPALELTSTPVNPTLPTDLLTLPRWSSLIEGPRLPAEVKARPLVLAHLPRPTPLQAAAQQDGPVQPTLEELQAKRLKTLVSRSKIRELALVSGAMVEVAYLAIRFLR
jgi:hypothetical protein